MMKLSLGPKKVVSKERYRASGWFYNFEKRKQESKERSDNIEAMNERRKYGEFLSSRWKL